MKFLIGFSTIYNTKFSSCEKGSFRNDSSWKTTLSAQVRYLTGFAQFPSNMHCSIQSMIGTLNKREGI